MKDGGETVCLIKPQFEAGREQVGKKGVVRDPEIHLEVLQNFVKYAVEAGYSVKGITFSPIKGPEGNIEYLGYLKAGEEASAVPDLESIVKESHEALSSTLV